MDVVSLRQQGVPGVVATLGTALTEEQARLFKRYAPEVWVCYDGDGAGQKAILRALDIFESQDMPARVIDIPGGMDPDEYVREKGADGFEALKPMPPCEYRMLRAADAVDLTTQDGRTQYAIACCNIMRKVKNPVELENYLDKLIVQTGFAREVLMRQIGVEALAVEQRHPAQTDRPLRRETHKELPEHVKAQQMLVNLMAAGRLERALPMDAAFVTEPYKTIARLLSEGQTPAAIVEQLDENVRDEAAQAMLSDSNIEADKTALAVSQCMNKIRLYQTEKRIEETKARMKEESSPEKRAELIGLLSQLMNELGAAKKSLKE